MTIRNVFVTNVALTIATIFGLSGAGAAVIYQVSPTGTLNTPAANSAASATAFDNFILTDASLIGLGLITFATSRSRRRAAVLRQQSAWC